MKDVRLDLTLFGQDGLVLLADVIGDLDIGRSVRFADDLDFLGWGLAYKQYFDTISFQRAVQVLELRTREGLVIPKLLVSWMENSPEGGGAIERGMFA